MELLHTVKCLSIVGNKLYDTYVCRETAKILCGQLNARCATCTPSIKLSTKSLRCFSTATATENDVTTCMLMMYHAWPHFSGAVLTKK